MRNKLDRPLLGNNPTPTYVKEIISWWNDSAEWVQGQQVVFHKDSCLC